jgi:arabinose-5-phosphate isomerase
VDETGSKEGGQRPLDKPVAAHGRERSEGGVDHLDTEMDAVGTRHRNPGFGKAFAQRSFDGGGGVGVHGSSSRLGRPVPSPAGTAHPLRIARHGPGEGTLPYDQRMAPTALPPPIAADCDDDAELVAEARRVVALEAHALHVLAERLDRRFAEACRLCLAAHGRVVVSGMGKSGHIARKIAATLASTGTPSFFVHPAEAAHGDLGMITAGDAVLFLSHSGETAEILALLPRIKRMDLPIILITGRPNSTAARHATVVLDAAVEQEACPHNLAPTTSTTAALALGDALALALLRLRGFTAEDFARAHPAGALGRRLLLRVEDLMHRGAEVPKVGPTVTVAEALWEMSRKGLGMTAVTDEEDRVLGVFTDGDLRRALDNGTDLGRVPIAAVMTARAKTIAPEALASEALALIERHAVNALLVVTDGRLVGALNTHDLLRAGVA